eukprot:2382901-Amphidinium_carterae.1
MSLLSRVILGELGTGNERVTIVPSERHHAMPTTLHHVDNVDYVIKSKFAQDNILWVYIDK